MPRRVRSAPETRRALLRSLAGIFALTAAACSSTHPLMPTPTLYTGPVAKKLFTDLPEDHRTPPVDLFFLTDRAAATKEKAKQPYTAERSRSLAFGSAVVEFAEGVSWDTLLRQSSVEKRDETLALELGPTQELGRFPPIPYGVAATADGISRAPDVVDQHEEATRVLHDELARRLAKAPRKELVLYIHGYHDDFESAALTMGQLCHFLGREFACGIFTWPAGGSRGILFGYNVDYESSTFAADHLRKAIRTVATTPGLERLHLLAHSRGTDVLATALSELGVEAYLQGDTLPGGFRIGQVALLAPDIDVDIAPSKIFRVLSDPDLPYAGTPRPRIALQPDPSFRLTIYSSPYDRALATSSWLFGSVARLGQIDREKLRPEEVEQIRRIGLMNVIQVEERTDTFGHGYFVSNPQVSSDLVAMLRYGLEPGDPGRPLVELGRPFWRVLTRKEARQEARKQAEGD